MSEYANHRIVIYKREWCGVSESVKYEYIKQRGGTAGSANAQFNFPMGIAMNSANHIIIADTYSKRIQVLDKDLN